MIVSTQDKSELYQTFDEEKYLGDYQLNETSDIQSFIRNIDGVQILVSVSSFEKLN